jgi:hypothetical protein
MMNQEERRQLDARVKARVAKRDPRASVCILDGKQPPSYLQVFGQVRIEDDREFDYDINPSKGKNEGYLS